MLICQICDKKGHSALNYFQRRCQICSRVSHTVATCFDKGTSSMPMSQPMYRSQQFQAPASIQQMNQPYVQHQNMPQQAISHVAFTAKTNYSHSAPQQEYWLLDSGATNHMTSDLSNLQSPTPYPSTETVTGANGESLHISHIGQSYLITHSHKLQLKTLLHVPQLSQHLLSMH